MSSTTVMIMAGGKGSRLAPLTCHRAKPAVPFGGRYRIIDFILSNFINSRYSRVYVLTQYMASSLIRHLTRNWHLARLNQFIEVVPAQMRRGSSWYKGTADSVMQNIHLLYENNPENIAVFGGDHIYKFDISQMEEYHKDNNADLTVAAIPVPIAEAKRFGVIKVDTNNKIIGFEEKPINPSPIPSNPNFALVSMGNYFFKRDILLNLLLEDSTDINSDHDFGKNIIPKMVEKGCCTFIYDFSKSTIKGENVDYKPYWRDVGTVDSFFDTNMDLLEIIPSLNLNNRKWLIRSAHRDYPPPRFYSGSNGQINSISDSLISEGTILHNVSLKRVVAGYDCYFHNNSSIENSVIMNGCNIGEKSRLKNVLFDKNCSVEPGTVIGENEVDDKKRFPFVTEDGRVIFPKGTHIPKTGPIELAQDMSFLLENDKATSHIMRDKKDLYKITQRERHSHDIIVPHISKAFN